MFENSIGKTIRNNLSNIPGWRTKKKIVVFESDDWGTVRTTSIDAVERLNAKGIDFMSLDAERYSYNDTLATTEDLSALFDVLTSVKDSKNRSAVFTSLSLVANPDFKAIKRDEFRNYYYENFTETLKRYKGCEGSFELWKQGMDAGIFIPQFHGREHLNIISWMHALSHGHPETIEVFNAGMWGYVNTFFDERKINYQEAFNFHDPSEIQILEEVIKDGLNIFESLFGYRATLFTAPNGPFPKNLELILASNGVKYISQGKIINQPRGKGISTKTFRYLGMKNNHEQVYITRNCIFEPSSLENSDWVNSCMHQIESAFRWNKPAIISSHRVNYIGSLNLKNRQNGLKQLKELLDKIIKRWPDVEFMSSNKLGLLIQNR